MVSPMELGVEPLNALSPGAFPGLLGFNVLEYERGRIVASVPIRDELLAPNGFLHAAVVVTLADTLCGCGTLRSRPEGSSGFTTVELKSNFVGTAREGVITCEARRMHAGRTTQVWDATVVARSTGKPVAFFRCTQMILWPT